MKTTLVIGQDVAVFDDFNEAEVFGLLSRRLWRQQEQFVDIHSDKLPSSLFDWGTLTNKPKQNGNAHCSRRLCH